MSTELIYCHWCKTDTLQVHETLGSRCQKCGNQNSYGMRSDMLMNKVLGNIEKNHPELVKGAAKMNPHLFRKPRVN